VWIWSPRRDARQPAQRCSIAWSSLDISFRMPNSTGNPAAKLIQRDIDMLNVFLVAFASQFEGTNPVCQGLNVVRKGFEGLRNLWITL